jgi:polysaccharide chain length determinant protein (PEP-CTERM system associated)
VHALVSQILVEVRSAWRFRWYGVAVAWVLCAAGWGVVALKPDQYEASASVYVDASSVLEPLLNAQIARTDVVSQLNYIRESLLSRENLEAVARDNNLVSAEVEASPPQYQGFLARFQQDIIVNATPQRVNGPEGQRAQGNTIFELIYRHTNRDKAVGVVTSLLKGLIEGTQTADQEDAETAERFLDDRIREYELRLQEAEKARADFRAQNSDRLPTTTGNYFEQIQTQRDGLEQVRRDLRLAESRRDSLRAQLSGETAVIPGVTPEAQLPANSIDARIREYRQQLDRLLLDFTERHPDVQNTRAALEQLEQQRAAQLRELGISDSEQEIARLGANPVFQALQISLNEAQVEVDTLRADLAQRATRLEELQALIEEVPKVEAELARLNRDYDIIFERYQTLIRSRETQGLTRKAAATDDIDFQVLNPPTVPFEPVGSRLLLFAVVFVGALAAGGTLCYLLSQMRPVFGSKRVLREVLGLPVFGAVNHVRPSRFGLLEGVVPVAASLVVLTVLFLATVAVELAGPGLVELVSGT